MAALADAHSQRSRSGSPSLRPRSISRPSLLPAFEPLSSSPGGLPRPPKRSYNGSPTNLHNRLSSLKHLPTPDPTSSTSILASSPPRHGLARPEFKRTDSSVSARVPLGDVRSATVSQAGEPLLFGRSSNSSHFQLSANRHISRVHVQAVYEAPSSDHHHGQVVIKCLGWNGARIRCQGQSFELDKGDTFASDKPHAEIILDVQDARVLVRWPPIQMDRAMSTFSDTTNVADETPLQTPRQTIPSSPPMQPHLQSPVSPSPHHAAVISASQTFIALPSSDRPSIEVYEDTASGDEQASKDDIAPIKLEEVVSFEKIDSQSSSGLSSLHDEDVSDHDEENDPVVHSFGPFGANLSARMASFSAASPERRREPLKCTAPQTQTQAVHSLSSGKEHVREGPAKDFGPIRNHVINQLAYSRLQSMPLSSIFNNLPASWKQNTETSDDDSAVVSKTCPKMTSEELKTLLEETPAIGEIARSGKDAAGKALENEFYYVPEMDADDMRKMAVASSLGKPGMRAARKQHKQYYWKRPRF